MKFVSSLQLPLSLSVLLGDDHLFLLKLVFKFLDDAELDLLIDSVLNTIHGVH